MRKDRSVLARELIVEVVEKIPNNERDEVLIWARKSLAIVENRTLSKNEKLSHLRKLESKDSIKLLLAAFSKVLKLKVWDNQSWARRLGIAGFLGGAITFGTQGAGIAALGTAIGVPLALISGVGAAFLGVVVDEIQKERNS